MLTDLSTCTQTLTQTDNSSATPSSSDDAPSSTIPIHSRAATMPSTISNLFRRDNLVVGTRVVIAADADLRGEISVGSGTVIHPKATILALQAPISIGSNCIIEETAVIVNRRSTPIKIGDNNLFEVGCRVEAAGVGNHNVFEIKCRVASNITVGSHCVVGAGCSVLPKPIADGELEKLFDHDEAESPKEQAVGTEAETGAQSIDNPNKDEGDKQVLETLPDQTVVYGADSKRRLWNGEGAQQQAALHAKHLEYLRDAIPRLHKLKIIQGIRAPADTTASSATT